ncbi:unnamed protein product [Chrysodeixis includens]|uniref:Uncharacterized protein n=1 Tax=Chrysodeixis includens TaxID=689277 RepID=A0A9N8L1B3_CHRIL|nr:unnamed protein product [Chrysodeixis includens]
MLNKITYFSLTRLNCTDFNYSFSANIIKGTAPRIEKIVQNKDQSTSSNNSRELIYSSLILQKTNTVNKNCCDRCQQKGLKVCEKNCPAVVSKNNSTPTHIEISKTYPEKKTVQHPSKNITCACSDAKNNKAQKTLIIMNSGRCSQCNKGNKDSSASLTSVCIETLFQEAKAYLEQLAEEHKNICPRCDRRPSCQSLNAGGSNESVSCKNALFEEARVYLTQLFSEHKRACESCKKKEPSCTPKIPSKPSFIENILKKAWSYVQNLGADKKSCCLTNKECCSRCMKLDLPTCCKHSTNTKQAVCQPCKPALKSPEKKKIECPRCKKEKSKSVCLVDCPSDTANKNICKHCKQSLGLEPKTSFCKHCKKDVVPVCSKHKDARSSSVFSITSLLQSFKKHETESNIKSCPKLCKKKSSDECFSPLPCCKSAEDAGCSFDPCKVPQPCCKKPVEKKPSCSGSCSKSSESLEDDDSKPCIGPCTKKCPIKRSGCDFVEYHSSTICTGPCRKNCNNKKMLGIQLSITPKSSSQNFCGLSCDAVKKIFCPYYDSDSEAELCSGQCRPQPSCAQAPACPSPPTCAPPPASPPSPTCAPPPTSTASPACCPPPASPPSPKSAPPPGSPPSPKSAPPPGSPPSPKSAPPPGSPPSPKSASPPASPPSPTCAPPPTSTASPACCPPTTSPPSPARAPSPASPPSPARAPPPASPPSPACCPSRASPPPPPCPPQPVSSSPTLRVRCSSKVSYQAPKEEVEEPACVSSNQTYSATQLYHLEHQMVDAEYEAFLDDQFGRNVARQLADKETICDENNDYVTSVINSKVRRAQSDDLNKYRFYY